MSVIRKEKKVRELRPYELYKLEKGEWMGTFPYGYKTNISEIRTKYSIPGLVILKEEEAKIVEDLFNIFSSGGHSIDSLTAYINKKHNIGLYVSKVHRIINNKFYYGVMTYKGHEYYHRYPKIITEYIFEKCQKVIKYNTKYRIYPKEEVYLNIEEVKLSQPELLILKLCKNPIDINNLVIDSNLSINVILPILTNLLSNNLIIEQDNGDYVIKSKD
jgi:Recombinase